MSNNHLNVDVLVAALTAIAEQVHGVPVDSVAYAMAAKAQQALHDAQYSHGVAPQPQRVTHYWVKFTGGEWAQRLFDETHGAPWGFYFYEGYNLGDARKIVARWNEQGRLPKANGYWRNWEYSLLAPSK